MKEITEDYVSYEIAVLLKEKGFDNEEVSENGGFYCDYECDGKDIGIVYESQMLNKDLARNEYLRPTHQMALKWLRQVHNVFISSDLDVYSNLYFATVYTQLQCATPNNHYGTELYINPKQAVEAALLYVLKNLI